MKESGIFEVNSKKFVGMQTKTSLSGSKTRSLWSQFIPRRMEVKNNVGNKLYSVQVYPNNFKMEHFTPNTVYTTWAAIEVTNFENIPDGMECYSIAGRLYAVFMHKGATSTI